MKKTVEADFVSAIVNNDLSVLRLLYKESLPEIVKYVKRNSGTTDDAKDIFQEAILIVFKKAQTDSLQLTTSFHNYIFGVCKNLWLKSLRKKGNQTVTFEDSGEYVYEDDLEENLIKSRKWVLFNKKFAQMGEECRRVLKMLFNKISGKEIAAAMGYTEEYAKRKKYKCKLQLAALVKNDPEFKNLIERN